MEGKTDSLMTDVVQNLEETSRRATTEHAYTHVYTHERTHLHTVHTRAFYFPYTLYYPITEKLNILSDLTWREDVRVEADVERRTADGADCLAGIEDNLAVFLVCLKRTDPWERGRVKILSNELKCQFGNILSIYRIHNMQNKSTTVYQCKPNTTEKNVSTCTSYRAKRANQPFNCQSQTHFDGQ